MSINREGAPLIWTHFSLKQVHKRGKEEACWRGEIDLIVFCVLTILVGIALSDIIYTKEVVGFSPLWFPRINLCVFCCCCYACLSFSDLNVMVMMK